MKETSHNKSTLKQMKTLDSHRKRNTNNQFFLSADAFVLRAHFFWAPAGSFTRIGRVIHRGLVTENSSYRGYITQGTVKSVRLSSYFQVIGVSFTGACVTKIHRNLYQDFHLIC